MGRLFVNVTMPLIGKTFAQGEEAELIGATTTQPTSSAGILLVDDSPANLLALEVTLERLGEEMVRATSGKEALQLIQQREFAVVILDVQMPVMDGLETAAHIRELEGAEPGTRHTPIIFVTAAEMTEDHVFRAYAEGAVDFIRKPYVPEIMRSKVKVFVELYRNTQQMEQSIADLRKAEDAVREANTKLERRVADRTAELRAALERAEGNELRYRTLAEAMPQIVWTATPEGRMDYFNGRWSEMIGMPMERALGWGWATSVHPDDLPRFEDWWRECLSSGQSLEVELRFRCTPGERYGWFLGRAEPMRSSSGSILKWLGTYTDIDTQKRAEAVLQEANVTLGEARDKAIEASNAKTLFLANMSHELRTPLNAIIGYAEILQEELGEIVDAKGREDIRRIILAGQHLLALINDVLDLAKIEAGKMELTLSAFALEPLIHQVSSSIATLAQQRNNKFFTRCLGDCGTMHADEIKVRQVLINLLSNACKFTENGTITLSVNRTKENGTQWVNISVLDTGIGIATDQLSKLFKEFSQADASATRSYGGTGLGLALSRKFVQMMGGTIDVKSQPNRGSEFIVHLPAVVQGSSQSLETEDSQISI
ncbi:MAG: hybrid sensor histidine kinase/response regulator [Candidatus Sumerlaeaceae bacterium]